MSQRDFDDNENTGEVPYQAPTLSGLALAEFRIDALQRRLANLEDRNSALADALKFMLLASATFVGAVLDWDLLGNFALGIGSIYALWAVASSEEGPHDIADCSGCWEVWC